MKWPDRNNHHQQQPPPWPPRPSVGGGAVFLQHVLSTPATHHHQQQQKKTLVLPQAAPKPKAKPKAKAAPRKLKKTTDVGQRRLTDTDESVRKQRRMATLPPEFQALRDDPDHIWSTMLTLVPGGVQMGLEGWRPLWNPLPQLLGRRELIPERKEAWETMWAEEVDDDEQGDNPNRPWTEILPFLWNAAELPHAVRRSHHKLIPLLARAWRCRKDKSNKDPDAPSSSVVVTHLSRSEVTAARRAAYWLSGFRAASREAQMIVRAFTPPSHAMMMDSEDDKERQKTTTTEEEDDERDTNTTTTTNQQQLSPDHLDVLGSGGAPGADCIEAVHPADAPDP